MSNSVALGWDVKNAFVAAAGGIFFSTGAWTADNGGGFPAWGYTVNGTNSCEAMVDSLLAWGSGKRCLALIRDNGAGAQFALGEYFGSLMQAYIVSLGGTFTRSGMDGNFGAYDWANYDWIFAFTASGAQATTFDAAIAARKSALIITIGASNHFSRYGIATSAYQTQYFAPDYFSYPFDCPPLGLTAKQIVSGSALKIVAGTNTMGGTYTIHPNTLAEGTVATWVP